MNQYGIQPADSQILSRIVLAPEPLERVVPKRLYVPETGSENDVPENVRNTLLPPVILLFVTLFPFWCLPLAHVLTSPPTATGFYHEELPYYVANGRAAFERGNGIAHPNPYDPSPDAPCIYAHWFLWLIGGTAVLTNADPGDVLLAVTCFSTVAFGTATWKLVSTRLKPETSPQIYFLMSMWGGGLLVPCGLLASVFGIRDPISSALQFDPGKGLWFLNWGRNAVFGTESLYHCLAAFCWISEMQGRRTRGMLCAAALATTHPWSGLQILLILNLWRLVSWVRDRSRSSLIQLAFAVTAIVLFLGYYRVWLPGFEHHRKLQTVWELDWSLSGVSACLAYCLVAIPASIRLREAFLSSRDMPTRESSSGLSDQERFLICALAVTCGLVFHDRFFSPVQPLHFTRGYLWMPLFLLGLPVIVRWIDELRSKSTIVKWASGFLFVLFFADNLAFSAIHAGWLWSREGGYHLERDDQVLIRQLSDKHAGAVVLTEDLNVNYLLPSYGSVRPWIGHMFNTPDYSQRLGICQQIFRSEEIQVEAVPGDVDLLVFRRSRQSNSIDHHPDWVVIESLNPTWTIRGRVTGGESASIATNSLSETYADDMIRSSIFPARAARKP